MLEILLKTIPFTPLLYWIFSKTFRMAKKRKFYAAQITILSDYIDNYYKKDTIEFSLRDLKARQVTCNDWVGAKFLDYAIEKKCPDIFGAVHDFDKAWIFVKLKELNNGEVKLVSKFKKKYLKIFTISIAVTYMIFGGLLVLNKALLISLDLANLDPILINDFLYNCILYFSVLLLTVSAILLLTIGNCVSSALSLANKLPIEFKNS